MRFADASPPKLAVSAGGLYLDEDEGASQKDAYKAFFSDDDAAA